MSLQYATARREHTLERILADYEAVAARLPEHVVARAARRRAAEQLREVGWPSWREENWRYANLRAWEQLPSFQPAAPAGPEALAQFALPAPIAGFERLVFLDGVAVPRASAYAGSHPAPIELPSSWPPEQRLGALTDLFALDSAVLRVREAASIELLFITSERGAQAAVYPRLLLELAAHARATLIERHLGVASASGLVCGNVRIELAHAAQLDHYRLQQCGTRALWSDTLSARLHSDARYRVRQIGLGAATARTSALVTLAGRGASVSWQALAVGRGTQVQDTALRVDHLAPETVTEERFRGIADEHARLAFSAHVLIDQSAPGAEARQSLRGLIEGVGAEIDLRPRLEIHTDEVRAQHGATTGRLDENQLFYLLARGIERKAAQALLKWAFLSDVLRVIELPQLRAEAERAAAGQLQGLFELGALS
jgi:Fe-S cluster assembly protein SufD